MTNLNGHQVEDIGKSVFVCNKCYIKGELEFFETFICREKEVKNVDSGRSEKDGTT